MSRRTQGLVVAAVLSTLLACGDSGGGDGGGSDAGAEGTSTTGPLTLPNAGDPNPDCTMVPPIEGPGTQRGPCCHRVSNAAKEALLGPDDDLRLEYRLQSAKTINHPLTIGDPFLLSVSRNRYDAEEQSTLWTFIMPREDGAEISGEGTAIIGSGRYNCDGTYSYFSDNAAPMRPIVEGDNPARWASKVVPTVVDVSLDGRERSQIPFADNPNRQLAHVPFLPSGFAPEGMDPLDWELVTQGFDIESIDSGPSGRDCMGSRDAAEWLPSGTFRLFTPLEHNQSEIITLISRTYCALVAFGLTAPVDIECSAVPRCMPGSTDCQWVKLPDSLCPSTDEERAMWGCHVGYEDNPDMEPTQCSQDAPTTVLDPDTGATSEGQCCNPMGDPAPNGLPACNAWMLRQEYVAAAAEITDAPSDLLPMKCQ